MARYVMLELKDCASYLRRSIRHYPSVRDMLAQSSKCAMCSELFLNTWLECVRFVDARKVEDYWSVILFTPCKGI